MEETTETKFKYDEKRLVEDFFAYVSNTYSKHYVGEDNIQALDLIFATGRGEDFCIGNALKYLTRYGKKNGKNKDDLLKAMHYTLLAQYLLYKENKVKEYANCGTDPNKPIPYQSPNEAPTRFYPNHGEDILGKKYSEIARMKLT